MAGRVAGSRGFNSRGGKRGSERFFLFFRAAGTEFHRSRWFPSLSPRRHTGPALKCIVRHRAGGYVSVNVTELHRASASTAARKIAFPRRDATRDRSFHSHALSGRVSFHVARFNALHQRAQFARLISSREDSCRSRGQCCAALR